MNLSKKLCLVFLLFAASLPGLLFADDNGQIINVNQNFQVAFTDLDNQSLKQGDIVKVFVSDTDFIFMQVLESSPILSKLGASQDENFKTNLTNLQRIAVGDKVIALSKANTVDTKITKSDSGIDSKNAADIASFRDQIKGLMEQLKSSKEEIRHLQDINLYLKTQISNAAAEPQAIKTIETKCQDNPKELTDTQSQLKIRLEKMQQLLDHE